MTAHDVAVRADRLGVILAVCSGEPHLPGGDVLLHGPTRLTRYGHLLLQTGATPDDLALANACLELEGELRERGYHCLERLCALAAGRTGALDDRLRSLPLSEFAAAAYDLIALGWVGPT